MTELPYQVYQTAQIRQLEHLAIQQQGISETALMEYAGQAAWQILQRQWPQARKIVVFCGAGNNGGDGYVLARLAQQHGFEVTVWCADAAVPTQSVALAAATACKAAGVTIQPFTSDAAIQADVIVDALFGIGLERPVAGTYRDMIAAMNRVQTPILAIDLPSGLRADSGAVLGEAVVATATVTFIGLKLGLLTGAGRAYAGEIFCDNLGLAPALLAQVQPVAVCLGELDLAAVRKPRLRSAHKGDYGHVLVVGGDYGYAGAVRLAAEAALRTGAGLVSAVTRPEHVTAIVASRPEIMCHGIAQADELIPLLQRATVIVIGPGLGQSDWSKALLQRVLASPLPKVIDADALNLLSQSQSIPKQENWVGTPHPGEAARLLGIDTAQVQTDRLQAVQKLQAKFGGVWVLKGSGTLIATGSAPAKICIAGNPGMATGGMGDVLSGIIASLLAQGQEPAQAAALGALLHATAADVAAAKAGERGLLAMDLFAALQGLVN